jgi:gliding motility-associated-like protein
MMANFNVNEEGWNGLYDTNKEALPSDYWYLAQMVDSAGNIQEFKGHFSLIRRN